MQYIGLLLGFIVSFGYVLFKENILTMKMISNLSSESFVLIIVSSFVGYLISLCCAGKLKKKTIIIGGILFSYFFYFIGVITKEPSIIIVYFFIVVLLLFNYFYFIYSSIDNNKEIKKILDLIYIDGFIVLMTLPFLLIVNIFFFPRVNKVGIISLLIIVYLLFFCLLSYLLFKKGKKERVRIEDKEKN